MFLTAVSVITNLTIFTYFTNFYESQKVFQIRTFQ